MRRLVSDWRMRSLSSAACLICLLIPLMTTSHIITYNLTVKRRGEERRGEERRGGEERRNIMTNESRGNNLLIHVLTL